MSQEITKEDENTLPFKGRDKVGMGIFPGAPSCPSGAQRSMKIEGVVIARAEGPKQSLNVAGIEIASHPPDARNDSAEAFSDERP
jgi:hypothetical protein